MSEKRVYIVEKQAGNGIYVPYYMWMREKMSDVKKLKKELESHGGFRKFRIATYQRIDEIIKERIRK